MEDYIDYVTYAANGLALLAAYFLSRGGKNILIGRLTGIMAAGCWITYGIFINNWSFVIADCIFVFIYVSAVIKFNMKRDAYRDELAKANAHHKRRYDDK